MIDISGYVRLPFAQRLAEKACYAIDVDGGGLGSIDTGTIRDDVNVDFLSCERLEFDYARRSSVVNLDYFGIFQ